VLARLQPIFEDGTMQWPQTSAISLSAASMVLRSARTAPRLGGGGAVRFRPG
jgi:hypothetical protein